MPLPPHSSPPPLAAVGRPGLSKERPGEATATPPRRSEGEPNQDDDRPYRLSPRQRYGLLALLLALFFFGSGQPVWENPFDVDWAVWLSYLPIPLLVLGCLLYSRRFSGVAWFLNTLELTAIKFAITYGFAIGMWALADDPPPRPEWTPRMTLTGTAPAPLSPEPAPSVTPWPAERTGTLVGAVVAADGSAVADALVYVSGGLEQVHAEVPAEPLELAIGPDSAGQLLLAREYQPIWAKSADGRMHNLVGSQAGRVLFNLPLLPAGTQQSLAPPAADEPVELRCMVHAPHGWRARLLVASSPHYTRSDAGGRFELKQVPALPLTLSALDRAGVRADQSVSLAAGGREQLVLRLAAPAAPTGQ